MLIWDSRELVSGASDNLSRGGAPESQSQGAFPELISGVPPSVSLGVTLELVTGPPENKFPGGDG